LLLDGTLLSVLGDSQNSQNSQNSTPLAAAAIITFEGAEGLHKNAIAQIVGWAVAFFCQIFGIALGFHYLCHL